MDISVVLMERALALFLLLVSVVAADTDYCSISATHVLCNNSDASHVDLETCGEVVYSGVTDSQKEAILQEHNNIRNSVAQGNDGQPSAANMLEMEWDDELALVAQAWANTCPMGIAANNDRRVDRFYVGSNLYIAYASKGAYVPVWSRAVTQWKQGIDKFDTSSVGSYVFNPQSASYSQLVWGVTSKVGCGLIAVVEGDHYNKGTYVCMYGPGGNTNGAPVYEVGSSCSNCPSGMDMPCSSTYTSLCSSGSSTPSNNNNETPGSETTTTEVPASGSQCTSDYCSFTEEHTLCKHPQGSISSENCGVPLKRLVSGAERAIILKEHNNLRSRVAEGNEAGQPAASNMREMVWDVELAVVAQALADQCVFEHDCNDCRRVKRFGVGQNLYISFTSASTYTVNWGAAVKAWYDEVEDFNPSTQIQPFKFTYATGHYSQVVWADSWKVGCGFTAYKDGSWNKGLYVCNYGPGGNFGGQAMYLQGASCTACPADTECSDDYDGLCQSTLPDECASATTTTTTEGAPTTTTTEKSATTTTTTEGTITETPSNANRCKPMLILGPKRVATAIPEDV